MNKIFSNSSNTLIQRNKMWLYLGFPPIPFHIWGKFKLRNWRNAYLFSNSIMFIYYYLIVSSLRDWYYNNIGHQSIHNPQYYWMTQVASFFLKREKAREYSATSFMDTVLYYWWFYFRFLLLNPRFLYIMRIKRYIFPHFSRIFLTSISVNWIVSIQMNLSLRTLNICNCYFSCQLLLHFFFTPTLREAIKIYASLSFY